MRAKQILKNMMLDWANEIQENLENSQVKIVPVGNVNIFTILKFFLVLEWGSTLSFRNLPPLREAV